MNLDELRKTWDAHGELDPLWAVLTWPEKKGKSWDEDEFFATGPPELEALLAEVTEQYPSLTFGRALDFGCGVGRLAVALAPKFTEVYGVDIASSMIRYARRHARSLGNCRFFVNTKDDLSLFEDDFFDFILSVIVLQHMETRYALRYIKEFIRTLKPGGLLLFQLPSDIEIRAPYEELHEGIEPRLEMYSLARDEVCSHIESSGGRLVSIRQDTSCLPASKGYRYYVTKDEKK